MENIKYYSERLYPYVAAGIIIYILIKMDINFIYSENLDSALDACNTIIALIIGFLGAILPVILGMKNESKIVKYIFEVDKNKLFLKYIKVTIFVGLLTLFVTISLYFVGDINEFPQVQIWSFYVWMYLLLCFILLTYRSLKSMLDLIFISDNDMIIARYKTEYNDDKHRTIKENFNEDV